MSCNVDPPLCYADAFSNTMNLFCYEQLILKDAKDTN